MTAVLGLVPDPLTLPVENLLGDLLARVGRQTVERDRTRRRLVDELAERATVPVINMLSPSHHPCQVLADLLTLRETFGGLDGLTLAYVGDGNNVARSLIVVGTRAGLEVRVAAPDGYQLEPDGGGVLTDDPSTAVTVAPGSEPGCASRP